MEKNQIKTNEMKQQTQANEQAQTEPKVLAEVHLKLFEDGGVLFTDKDGNVLRDEIYRDFMIETCILRAAEVVEFMKNRNENIALIVKTVDEVIKNIIQQGKQSETKKKPKISK